MTSIADQVVACLVEHGEMSSREIALEIRRRRADVLDALADDRLYTALRPDSRGIERQVWGARASLDTRQGTSRNGKRASANTRLLAILSDGAWHSHRDLYRIGCIVHSRIAELRARGHRIECERRDVDGDPVWFYRLDTA